MPGQDNSVCPAATSKALIAAEIRHDAASDRRAWNSDGRDRLPVGPVRHGRRADPDRRALDHPAAAVGDGAARHHADGLERLARLPVARAYPLAAGHDLHDRLRTGARRLVDHALCAGQADRAAPARHYALHGADDAQEHQAQSRQHPARHLLRFHLHGPDADDRRLRSLDGHFFTRRQFRTQGGGGVKSDLPGREPFREAGLFRRHHRSGGLARSGAGGGGGRSLHARHHAGAAHPGGDERRPVPHLGQPADHHHRLLLYRLWRLAAAQPAFHHDVKEELMRDATDALVLDLVEWIAREPRLYSEVIDTWRTSCPRLTIWEDAVDRGYVARRPTADGLRVTVTEGGEKFLREHGRIRPN